jgi:hypothetical protein
MVSFIPRSLAQRGKSEIAFGYGYYSSFSFANHGMNMAPYSTSSGTWALNYRYYLTKDVTLGLGVGVESISSWASFVTIAPEATFCYLDTRHDYIRVRLYGSVSMGITVLTDKTLGYGEADESGLKLWGFQGTPFGMRIGRQFAGFVELGYGYKGLIHGGIALRFPRILATHRRVEN